MRREYLEDYHEKEQSEYGKLINRIWRGQFSFRKDRYPPDRRFVKLQRPVALTSPHGVRDNLWAQLPFCGSLILILLPLPKSMFERFFFKASDIPKIIDFIKETGKVQIAIGGSALAYEGLDFLDPFFNELKPPAYHGAPECIFGSPKEIRAASETFNDLAGLRLVDYLHEESQRYAPKTFEVALENSRYTYVHLKLGHYAVVEELENLMVDDPQQASSFVYVCRSFIIDPLRDLRSDLRNFALEDIKKVQDLPLVYQPENIQFPCEIGQFLLKKLTYAPSDIRACNELIDHYAAYDLQKVLESMNEAVVTNLPDVISKSAEELSTILDNIWSDETIPKRIEDIKIGVPVSMAAVGAVAGGLIGGTPGVAAGGFLAELGFKVAQKAAEKFFAVKGEGLSERLAKLRAKSYQANIYDFKKKYKSKIAQP